MIKSIRRFAIAVIGAASVLSVGAQDAAAPPSTLFAEAKITVNDRARAAGYLRVRLQPDQGEPREATIAVEKRMSENDIAKSLTEALTAAVGVDYRVDRDGGEHVKIRKANRNVADFFVEIAFSAPGFAIVLEN
jgi:hypothetical protein